MSQEYITGIIGLMILSVIANVIFDKFVVWMKARRERRRQANMPIDDPRPFRVDVPITSSSRTTAPALPIRPQQNTSSQNHGSGSQVSPRIIAQNTGMPVLCSSGIPGDPLDFPMCPIHRCCNRRGKTQMISWDCDKKMWRCCKNHHFNS